MVCEIIKQNDAILGYISVFKRTDTENVQQVLTNKFPDYRIFLLSILMVDLRKKTFFFHRI